MFFEHNMIINNTKSSTQSRGESFLKDRYPAGTIIVPGMIALAFTTWALLKATTALMRLAFLAILWQKIRWAAAWGWLRRIEKSVKRSDIQSWIEAIGRIEDDLANSISPRYSKCLASIDDTQACAETGVLSRIIPAVLQRWSRQFFY
jgi:hypothetical protein